LEISCSAPRRTPKGCRDISRWQAKRGHRYEMHTRIRTPAGCGENAMPSTHSILLYHLIFSTKDRYPFLTSELRSEVHAYLGGCLRDAGGVPLEIGGVADHIHILAGLKPTHSVAAVLRETKQGSSEWIHKTLGLKKFAWQVGYGAFTVSLSLEHSVRRYIRDQERHHKHRTFQEEYVEMLRRCEIKFDDRYLW